MASAAHKVQVQADVVRWFLRELVTADMVSGTVMFWGSDIRSPADVVIANRDGVHLVHGRDSRNWLELFATSDNNILPPEKVDAVVARLRECLIPDHRLRDAKPPKGWTRP
jgi:hypothetical protein